MDMDRKRYKIVFCDHARLQSTQIKSPEQKVEKVEEKKIGLDMVQGARCKVQCTCCMVLSGMN